MRLLIVGGAGFVGANLAVGLAEEYAVTVMDNLVRPGAELNLSRLQRAGVRVVRGDVRCAEDWPVMGYDAVILTAAQPSAIDGYQNPTFDFSNNYGGVLRALEHCRQSDCGLIFFSTNKVYPVVAVDRYLIDEDETRFVGQAINEDCPLDGALRSLYGASKVAADLTIQEWADAFQIPAVVNRCSCLSGPWQWGKVGQGWVAWWVIAHVLGLPLTYCGFQGKQVRDVLFMPDLLRLIRLELETLHSTVTPRVFNVGGGWANACSLIEMTRLCQTITGREVPIEALDVPRRADFRWYVSCTDRVRDALDWTPRVNLQDGLVEIHEWVLQQRALLAPLYL